MSISRSFNEDFFERVKDLILFWNNLEFQVTNCCG